MATRTNAKELLIQAFNKDLPPGFAEFMQTALPELDDTAMDAEESLSWQGILARYLCAVFGSFTGLFPLEIPLRIGQHNAVSQALLLASLEATRKVGAYYDTDLSAAAESLKEQIEGVAPVEGVVSIDEEFWQGLYTGVGELLAAFKASPDAADAWYDAIQISQVISTTLDGMTDDLSHIADSTWMSLTSLARLLLSNIQGGV